MSMTGGPTHHDPSMVATHGDGDMTAAPGKGIAINIDRSSSSEFECVTSCLYLAQGITHLLYFPVMTMLT